MYVSKLSSNQSCIDRCCLKIEKEKHFHFEAESTASLNILMKKAADTEVFLEHKRKKKWFDNKSGYVCFELYARSLFITWGQVENWSWKCFKETSEENIEVAKLSHVCWLDVRGKFMISELCAGIVYEILYVVKLPKGGTGWELPITLKLTLPGGNARERQVSLLEKPRGEWIELNVGNFRVENGENGEVYFDLMEHGGHWKTGLLIKSVIIRPKS